MNSVDKKIENKQLVEKFPWLRPFDFFGNEIENYDYSFTILDEIPEGWKIAFGELLAEDIQKVLDEQNIDDFKVLQIKEKYGELRLYHNSAPKEIDKIIHAYSTASANICFHCGKPDVTQSKGYWIWTCCTQCFNKLPMAQHRKYEDEFGDNEYEPMQDEYYYSMFSEKGTIHCSENISEYTTKIRKRYEERMK